MQLSNPKSEFLHVMYERGYLDDCSNTSALDTLLAQSQLVAYIGFDATAQSLHVGSLTQIMILRWLQKTNNKPIVLMGGGTTKIGDPSFRSDERPLLSNEAIKTNISGIKKIFARYLTFGDQSSDSVMVDNSEWLDELFYIKFLREIGQHFSVNRMLAFESVKSRLDREQSLSFLEFNYMILQAYDFLELNRRYDCRIQVGGSDQWGNILNGVDLIRRITGTQAFALTSPLLTTADGKKMGKTVSGAIWLNADACTPYEFWQYWRNVHDRDVGRFLKLFTELETNECERLGALGDKEINEAKIILANEVTSLAHGPQEAQRASKAAIDVFTHGNIGDALPTLEVSSLELEANGLPITKALVLTGLVNSGKEARRKLASGSVRVNNQQIREASEIIETDLIRNAAKISVGKKRHAKIVLSD